jgi:hypothetical protein
MCRVTPPTFYLLITTLPILLQPVGGPTLRADLDQGPYDQAPLVESRNDVLVFTTDAFTQNVVLKGKPSVHLKVASDKTDTDFCVRLTDVYPDGRSMLVSDGVMRMRFRNGTDATDTAAMVPNQIYDCVIDLPNTSITFLAGHKLRVDITSSNYPRFNRNMNTGGTMYPAGKMDTLINPQVAANKVYTNSLNQSYISLMLENYTTNLVELAQILNFNVYPNPATGAIKIETGSNESYQITIFNTLSQVVLTTQTTDSKEVDISALSNGTYVVEIKQHDKIGYQKLIKN